MLSVLPCTGLQYITSFNQFTEVGFNSFLSGRFFPAIVVNPSKSKLANLPLCSCAKQTTVSTVLIFILWLYVLSLEESVQSLMQLLSAKVQTTPNVNNVRSRSAKAGD